MTSQIFTTEHFFWLVVVSFYVLDNLRLIPRNDLLLRVGTKRGCLPIINTSSYEFKGKSIALLNLALPFSMIIQLTCAPQKPSSTHELQDAKKELADLRTALVPFQIISGLSFLTIGIGIALTVYFGLVFALIIFLPLHVLLLICTILLLYKRRGILPLPKKRLYLLGTECFLVPAYLTNITRRISLQKKFRVDGYIFALDQAPISMLEEIKYKIHQRLDAALSILDETSPEYAFLKKYKRRIES